MVAPSGRPQRCEKRSSPRPNQDAGFPRQPVAAEAERGEPHGLRLDVWGVGYRLVASAGYRLGCRMRGRFRPRIRK